MRNRPKSDPVNPAPPMPRGETEAEERRIETDFVAVFKRITDTDWEHVRDGYEYAYRAGRAAAKGSAT